MIESPPAPLCMLRRDPSLHMVRFYRVEILTDLFGQTVLERGWGRIGSRGQIRLISYPSPLSAQEAASKLIQAKERRGYRRLA